MTAKTIITAEASAYGLGAVLLQQQEDKWNPVASRSLSETECHYAQIERRGTGINMGIREFIRVCAGKSCSPGN